MEETESRASQLSRSKAQLQSQVDELKKQLDEEIKVSDRLSSGVGGLLLLLSHGDFQGRQAVGGSLASARQEREVLKEQLEEEQESKQELQRLVSKLNSEVTHWRGKHEADTIQHTEELEETKWVV